MRLACLLTGCLPADVVVPWHAGSLRGWLAGWLASPVSTLVGGCWAVSLMFAGSLFDRPVD